ncbi:MAG TPA: hypothetical protein VFY05_06225 [Candidatus Angelobacter sp.]|nr:hypothetical protein [Candidatus Angelobacter sp.]
MDPFARKMWHFGIGFAASLIILVVGLKFFTMHLWPQCPDHVIGEANSPGKNWVAAILERRCGPEDPFFAQVNLRPAGPLDMGFLTGQAQKGTVFMVEQDASGAGISLVWSGPDTLTIRCPHCTMELVRHRDQRWGPVKIQYEIP